MQLRRIVYTDGDQFLTDYLKDFPNGGLFVAGSEVCELGEPVLIELVFPEIPEGIFISGRATWRRLPTRGKSSLPSGIGVQFDPAERAKRDFILEFATGAATSMRKRSRRIPAHLRVDYTPIDRVLHRIAETMDIGRGGLFLHTNILTRYGSSVQMTVFPPNPLEPAQAMGRVAWVGHLRGSSGMGIQFLFRSADARVEIDRLVASLEAELRRGTAVLSA